MTNTAELLPDAKAALTSAVKLRDYGEVARILSGSIVPEIDPALDEPHPIEIALCKLCGCAIEDLEELIYLRAADLIAQWERADPRDCWRHSGEEPPRAVKPAPAAAQPYRTPQATIDAFWYVISLRDPARFNAWLDDHSKDATFLLKLLDAK
jgi:hypothetical protein